MPDESGVLALRGVEKQYGALRPLRIRELQVAAGTICALVGFDLPAAETFINLITGAILPDSGEVVTLGHPTASIVDGDEWLKFVEQFGFVSGRVALLESMTVLQNLALPFGLELDPVPADVARKVHALAAEAGIEEPELPIAVAEARPALHARLRLARALALDPSVLVLEHPTAELDPKEAASYASVVRRCAGRRRLTVVALSIDDTLGAALGGRVLAWDPASGALKERRRWF